MVALDLKGITGTRARRRAEEVMASVGLGEKYQSLPEDLSGGQKQRLAIARALAGDPDIILADEPTAALDSANGRLVVGLLCDLAKSHGRKRGHGQPRPQAFGVRPQGWCASRTARLSKTR